MASLLDMADPGPAVEPGRFYRSDGGSLWRCERVYPDGSADLALMVTDLETPPTVGGVYHSRPAFVRALTPAEGGV